MYKKLHNIGYFVFNLDTYSGSALQAYTLAKNIKNYRIIIFNTNWSRNFRKQYVTNRIIIFSLPKNLILRLYYIVRISTYYRIKIYHLHGMYLIGLLIGIALGKKIYKDSVLFIIIYNKIEY